MIMRGSVVVLALAIIPLVASEARAQDTASVTSSTSSQKCVVRDRGNPSETGLANRADPTQQGNKDCAPVVIGHSTISGSVFFDFDQDGLLGPDEVGLSGWTVQLTGPSTQTVLSMGDAGTYSFTGLLAGTYTVCVVPNPGWLQTGPKNGTSCPNGLGYTIVAPNTDASFPNTNFGYVNAP
jgi:hypothetical protein